MSDLISLGRAELIDFIDLEITGVPAKVDTGADSCSLWASKVKLKKDGLHCVLFGKGSPFYTGREVKISRDYSVINVTNSFGHKELRYKVKLRVKVKGRPIKASFTLADRSQNTYPVLIGRKLLRGKFLVDVSQGEILHASQRARIE